MSNFFEKMMPDNFEELAFLGGIVAISYKVVKYFKTKELNSTDFANELEKLIKDKKQEAEKTERELIKQFKTREAELLKEIEENTIPLKARSFLSNLREEI